MFTLINDVVLACSYWLNMTISGQVSRYKHVNLVFVAGVQLNGHFYKLHGILQWSLIAVTERGGHPAKTIARV